MRKSLLLIFILFSWGINAQIISNDTVVCNSFQSTLYAVGSELSSLQMDDSHDTIVDIGFTFDFYANSYTQLVISGNGYITFDLTQSNQYSPWSITGPVPNPGVVPENAIMAPWHDINTGIGGSVLYGMSGIAPNRFFVVTWCQVPMFSCVTDLVTQQVILYEGSGKIEMFIQDKPLCLGWNGGAAIQGLVDATSANFDIVNDPTLMLPRNFPLPWTATNEGWEFTPNSSTSYNINQITYVPIDVGINYWLNSFGDTLSVGNTLNIDINTTTTYYTQVVGDCYNLLSQDSITIVIDSPIVELGPDYNIACNSNTVIDPEPFAGFPPYTYSWNTGSVDTLIDVGGGLYIVEITDNYGCIASDTIEIFEDPSPSFDLGIDYNIACNTTTLLDPNVVGGTPPYTYTWNNGSTDSIVLASDGYYILSVSDVYGCGDSDTITITEDAPPLTTVTGGGSICADGSMASIYFSYTGLQPWDLQYTDGLDSFYVSDINVSEYILQSNSNGIYSAVEAKDFNECISQITGEVEVIVNQLPIAIIIPNEITIYEGEEVMLDAGEYLYYEWYSIVDTLISTSQVLSVTDSGRFYIIVEDDKGCIDTSEIAIVRTVPKTELFIPSSFTPNNDDHNELFVIRGLNVITFNIQIFNRWGEIIFESNRIDKYWDGGFREQKVPEGLYYYHIKVLGKDENIFETSGDIRVIY